VAHACHPSYSGGRDQSGGLQFKASLGKQFARPYLKKSLHKKGLAECSRCKALSSSPVPQKKKKKPKNKTEEHRFPMYEIKNSVNTSEHLQ
jgi:hypothetical protein